MARNHKHVARCRGRHRSPLGRAASKREQPPKQPGKGPGTTHTSPSTPPSRPPAGHKLYWGAVLGKQLTGGQAPWDWNAVTTFQNQDAGGKPLSILHWGSTFYSSQDCGGACEFTTPMYDKVRAAGVIPWISWQTTSSAGEAGMTDAAIAAGSQDAYITQWAQDAKAWGHPFFLRFDWEMNGNWMPWGMSQNGNTAASYVAMWRHVHDIFTRVGATNVSWVWCPNADPGNWWAGQTHTSLASLYPGDAYVDWTCLDVYNTNDPGWKSFHDLAAETYSSVTGTIAPSKPMIIGEVGSTEAGGSKAAWIADLLTALPVSFPKIYGLLWYDVNSDGPGPHSDWPIASSTTARAAFATGIQNPLYTTNTFSNLDASPIPVP